MSENLNPYQSPQADLNAPKPFLSGVGLTETMVRYLKEASPWLRFIGILGFIGCSFMFLGGIIMMFAMPMMAASAENFLAGFFSSSIGIVYIILGVVMFLPARFTYNFGTKIRSYLQSNNEQDLELALKNNKSLWKFYGILCIVYLALIPVGIVVGIISLLSSGLF